MAQGYLEPMEQMACQGWREQRAVLGPLASMVRLVARVFQEPLGLLVCQVQMALLEEQENLARGVLGVLLEAPG